METSSDSRPESTETLNLTFFEGKGGVGEDAVASSAARRALPNLDSNVVVNHVGGLLSWLTMASFASEGFMPARSHRSVGPPRQAKMASSRSAGIRAHRNTLAIQVNLANSSEVA